MVLVRGILLAVSTFLIIGLCRRWSIKTEYYFSTACLDMACVRSRAVPVPCLCRVYSGPSRGAGAYSFLWGISELLAQEKQAAKGWFPMNPKH